MFQNRRKFATSHGFIKEFTNIHTKKIAFFFITFTGMSVRCAAFGGFNCVISLYISLKLISDK